MPEPSRWHRPDACRSLPFWKQHIVLESRSAAAAGHELDAFLEEAAIELEPVTPAHAQAAGRAWRRFGKVNHPAG